MLASLQIGGEQMLSGGGGEDGSSGANEQRPASAAAFADEGGDPRAAAGPMLPAYWGAAQESPPHRAQEDVSPDVWKYLSADSPSILRLQCLWSYFGLPALSLADSVADVASIAAQTDGFRSVLQVSSPMLHNPHVESVKDIYFAKDFRAIVFTGIQLAVDLRAAGDAFEKALRLRDQHMLPSLLVVRNVPAVRMERDGSLSPCGYVTVRKHKAFRWIVSLAPSNARAYDVFDMVEGLELGDCSGLFVIGTWILDLRTFSALKMLFRSDLRNSRTTPPEYLFEAAFEAFGGVLGQQEGDEGLEDPLELGRPEEVTGSTALPVSSEGTQERGTPSSLPEAEPSDEEESNKLPEHACDALRGSPLKQSLSLEDQQQERLEEDTTLSAASMKANGATQSRGEHPRLSAGSCFQDREHSPVAPKPFYEDSGSHAAMKHDEHIDSCPKREPVSILQNGETGCQLSTDASYKDLSVQFPQSEQWLERPKDMQAAPTLSREETREDDQHTPIAVKAEKAECLRNNNTSHRCLTTTTSDVHDEFETRTNSFGDHSAEKPGTDENNHVEVAKARDAETPSLETSAVAKATFDEVIEKQLHSWMAVNGIKYCGHKSSALVERCYPSHEFEYWAVEDLLVTADQNYESDEPGTLSLNCGDEVFLLSVTNTSWAFCRKSSGEFGYVPTVAVPCAFRKIFKHTKMYARNTASVDRLCKWKDATYYPGDPVVILAEFGKWVLVRDYLRPFRQAYIPRARIKQYM